MMLNQSLNLNSKGISQWVERILERFQSKQNTTIVKNNWCPGKIDVVLGGVYYTLNRTTNTMDNQDWTPLTIQSAQAQAQAKAKARQGTKVAPEVAHARKLETSELVKLKQLAPESRQEMVAKRVEMKLTQAELNQRCNFPVHSIRDFEAGRVCPSIGQLNTLNRILKTGLKLV